MVMCFFLCKQRAAYEIRLSRVGSEMCIGDMKIPGGRSVAVLGPGGEDSGGCYVAVLGPGGEDSGGC